MFNKIIDSLSSRLYMKLVPVFVLLGYYGVFYAAFRTKFTRVAVKAFAFNWPVTISNSCITYMALFLPALVICAFLLCASISRAEASHGKPAASAYPGGKESGNPQSNNGHPSSQKQPGDKKEDGEDTKPDSSADLQNKLSEDARALLELLKKLSESGNLSTQEISLLQSYLGSKNAPAGRALSDIINVLPPEALPDVISAIEQAGRLLDSENKHSFSMSGLSVAFLLVYIHPYVNEAVWQNVLGMFWYLLPDDSRITEAVAHMLQCAKKTLVAARDSLPVSGLAGTNDMHNKQGAGRPGASVIFEAAIEPYCTVAGLSNKELEDRTVRCNIERAKFDSKKIVEDTEKKNKEPEDIESTDTPEIETVEGVRNADNPNDAGKNADNSEHEPDATKDSKKALDMPEQTTETINEGEQVQNASAQAATDTLKDVESTQEKPVQTTTAAKEGEKAPETSSDTEDGDDKNPEAPAQEDKEYTYDNLLEYYRSIKEQAENILRRLDDLYNSGSIKDRLLYRDTRENITAILSKIEEVVNRLGADIPGGAPETVIPVGDDKENTAVNSATAEIFTPVRIKVLYAAVSLLNDMCQTVLRVMDDICTRNLSPYWAGRSLSKVPQARIRKKIEQQLAWDSYIISAIEDDKIQETHLSHSAADVVCIDFSLDAVKTLQLLDTLADRLQEALNNKKGQSDVIISEALARLKELRLQIDDATHHGLSSQNSHVRYSVAVLVETYMSVFTEWLSRWESEETPYAATKAVSRLILGKQFKDTSTRVQVDVDVARQLEAASQNTQEEQPSEIVVSTAPDTDETDNTNSVDDDTRRKITAHIQAVLEKLMQLKDNVVNGESNRKKIPKKPSEVPVNEAAAVVEAIILQFTSITDAQMSCGDARVWAAMEELTNTLDALTTSHLSIWSKSVNTGHFTARWNKVKKLIDHLVTKKFSNFLKTVWKRYASSVSQIKKAQNTSDVPDSYVSFDTEDAGYWIGKKEGARLSPEKRCELILRLWNEGKDPRDIKTWIEYIIEKECSKNYGDASSEMKCCKINRRELRNAFLFLTGISFSETLLWRILTEEMGYSGRQCAKLEQVGKAHPLKEVQLEHIGTKLKDVDPKKTLVISIDTKAFVVLGRLKHDNGILMCSPDGRIFRVYDHDFPFDLSDIYPDGTTLVDPSRMKEKAVLHPVGVFCPNDNTGFVSLVLGKDTAESMRNLIQSVINIKRKTMPELEDV